MDMKLLSTPGTNLVSHPLSSMYSQQTKWQLMIRLTGRHEEMILELNIDSSRFVCKRQQRIR